MFSSNFRTMWYYSPGFHEDLDIEPSWMIFPEMESCLLESAFDSDLKRTSLSYQGLELEVTFGHPFSIAVVQGDHTVRWTLTRSLNYPSALIPSHKSDFLGPSPTPDNIRMQPNRSSSPSPDSYPGASTSPNISSPQNSCIPSSDTNSSSPPSVNNDSSLERAGLSPSTQLLTTLSPSSQLLSIIKSSPSWSSSNNEKDDSMYPIIIPSPDASPPRHVSEYTHDCNTRGRSKGRDILALINSSNKHDNVTGRINNNINSTNAYNDINNNSNRDNNFIRINDNNSNNERPPLTPSPYFHATGSVHTAPVLVAGELRNETDGKHRRPYSKATSGRKKQKPATFASGSCSDRRGWRIPCMQPLLQPHQPLGMSPVVIDGFDLAMFHGRNKKLSIKGIEAAVNWFVERSHPIAVVIPHWLFYDAFGDENCFEGNAQDNHLILQDLWEDGILFILREDLRGETSRDKLSVKEVSAVVDICNKHNALLCSNSSRLFDTFCRINKEAYDKIKNRQLVYSFDVDEFMPCHDQFGRHGKFASELLTNT